MRSVIYIVVSVVVYVILFNIKYIKASDVMIYSIPFIFIISIIYPIKNIKIDSFNYPLLKLYILIIPIQIIGYIFYYSLLPYSDNMTLYMMILETLFTFAAIFIGYSLGYLVFVRK